MKAANMRAKKKKTNRMKRSNPIRTNDKKLSKISKYNETAVKDTGKRDYKSDLNEFIQNDVSLQKILSNKMFAFQTTKQPYGKGFISTVINLHDDLQVQM